MPHSGLDPGFFVGGGRGPILGGFGLQRGHFSVKMYAKTKELGPVGGACAGHAPPRSAYAIDEIYISISKHISWIKCKLYYDDVIRTIVHQN